MNLKRNPDCYRPKGPPPPEHLRPNKDDRPSAKWAIPDRTGTGPAPVPSPKRNPEFFARVKRQVARQQAKHAAAAAAARHMEALILGAMRIDAETAAAELAKHFGQ